MDAFSLGIIQNVAASVILVLAGYLITRSIDYLRFQKSGRKVWALNRQTHRAHIAIASLEPQQTGLYKRPSTGLGEVRAVAYVHESLERTYGKRLRDPELLFSSRFPAPELRQTLITIGGGRHNNITKIVSRHYNFPFVVHTDPETHVIDQITGKQYTPRMNESDVLLDYALIARIPNPFNPHVVAFILRGTHTHGVAGAGRLFSSDYINELRKATKPLGPWWQVITAVEFVDDEVFPKILVARQVDPSDVYSDER